MPDTAARVAVPAAVHSDNSAWVVVPSRLDPDALRRFCADVERLFRINPYLEIAEWDPLGDDRFRVRWRNLSNEQAYEASVRAQVRDDGLLVHYDDGLKRSTRFSVAAGPQGGTLTIVDDYGEIDAAEATARLAEVDKSLTAWGEALRVYLTHERRWSRFAPYRWYRTLWLRLKPSARRIATLLILFTLAEFVFLAFVVLIYWLEFA